MKAFRKLLARTPFYGVYKALAHSPDYWYGKLRGKPNSAIPQAYENAQAGVCWGRHPLQTGEAMGAVRRPQRLRAR